jgi:hypothetical protein
MATYSIKYHKLPIYSADIVVVHHTRSNFYEVLNKVCDRYGLNPDISSDLHLCHGLSWEHYTEEKGQYFYLFVNTDYKKEYFDTFLHECYHLIRNLKKHFNLHEDDNCDNEQIAYLSGYLPNLLINKKLIK